MLNTPRAYGGMATAPHHLAAQTGAAVLRAGGNALEAMVAMAATISVVYPHMNSIGGDGFWLVSAPGKEPLGIQACGPAAAGATPDFYAAAGCKEAVAARGGLSALTVAGTVGGWIRALELARAWGGRMQLADLLGDAIRHARTGVAVSASQARLTKEKQAELRDVPGFAETYLSHEAVPEEGVRLKYDKLAETLDHLALVGLEDFYRGDVARALASDLEASGSPLRMSDLEGYQAQLVAPLKVPLQGLQAYNLPPPTQGVASLMILAILDRLRPRWQACGDYVHNVVEATKQAFMVRDAHVFDPAFMTLAAADLLTEAEFERMAAAAGRSMALDWPRETLPGDTVWMGVIDGAGQAVSFIQSLYWEFGSGVV